MEPRNTKKRHMDDFLLELKSIHNSSSANNNGTNHNNNNNNNNHLQFQTSTNLFVQNLAPTTTEDTLIHQMAVCGPVASVKIMWPRYNSHSQYTKHNQIPPSSNNGFIAFMTRHCAEAAFHRFNGASIDKSTIRLDWSKPVPLPQVPLYTHPEYSESAINDLATNDHISLNLAHSSQPPPSSRKIIIPSSNTSLFLIHRTIERVIAFGPEFEASLLSREINNQDTQFSFLWNRTLDSHHYYQWRLWSLLNGDDLSRWSMKPTSIFTSSRSEALNSNTVYIPPEWPVEASFDSPTALDLPFMYAEDVRSDPRSPSTPSDDSSSDDDSDNDEYGDFQTPRISSKDLNRPHLYHLLHTLNFSTYRIARAMNYILLNSTHVSTIIPILISSLTNPLTAPFPTKLSRLYLVVDILHNASSPASIDPRLKGAWKFRNGIYPFLGDVFEHFGRVCSVIQSRLKREAFRVRVERVIEAWKRDNVWLETEVEVFKKAWDEGREVGGSGNAVDVAAASTVPAGIEMMDVNDAMALNDEPEDVGMQMLPIDDSQHQQQPNDLDLPSIPPKPFKRRPAPLPTKHTLASLQTFFSALDFSSELYDPLIGAKVSKEIIEALREVLREGNASSGFMEVDDVKPSSLAKEESSKKIGKEVEKERPLDTNMEPRTGSLISPPTPSLIPIPIPISISPPTTAPTPAFKMTLGGRKLAFKIPVKEERVSKAVRKLLGDEED